MDNAIPSMRVPSPEGSDTLQVKHSHYSFFNYLSLPRWNSYWHQIGATLDGGHVDSALYVGVGDNIVPSILETLGIRVSRFDYDHGLGVDVVGDIRNVGQVVPDASVDAVICCQVLEHIPFDDFEKTVAQLARIARKRLIISLPYCHYRLFGVRFKIPKVPLMKTDFLIPRFWKRWDFDGQHYWEVGTRGYSKARVERVLARYGSVVKAFHAGENPYHVFYVIEV